MTDIKDRTPSSQSDLVEDKLLELEVQQLKMKQQELERIDSTHNDGNGKDKEMKKKEKKEKKPSLKPHQLFRYASAFDLLAVFFASIGSAAIGVLQPVSIIIFGDFLAGLGSSITDPAQLLDSTIDMILIFVYIGTAMLVGGYFTHMLWVLSGENQAKRIRQLYVHSILRQDMAWFDKAEEGSLTTRLATDTQMVQEGISEKLGMVIQMTAQVIAGFVIAFVKGWQLAVIILATVPILGIVGGAMGYYYSKFTQTAQDSYAQAGSIAEQAFAGIRTVYAFSLQGRFSERYDKELDKAEATGSRRGVVMGIQIGVFMFVLFCTYALSFWYGGKLVDEGTLTGDIVLIAFFAMLMGTMSLLSLPMNLAAVASACGAGYRIFAIIDRVPDIDPDALGGIKDGKLSGHIEFRNVDFSYPTRPDIQVLKGFSAEVRPGQSIALVGSSGSGKSTTVQLLQRFYDAMDGEVLVDGRNIKDYNVQWLRSQIGVVSQEPVLFNMSLRKNLLMGAMREVTDTEIIEACKKANCHSFITQLPKGYDTMVGQQGSMLSGGQKQRVAIARAILKNPSILLLDEATSALDTKSERIVQSALDVASQNRTTLMIAHRLSTIRNADLIIVMKQGEVVEKGNHYDLIAQDGAYAELVRKQLIAMEEEQDGKSDDSHNDDDATPVDDGSVVDEKEEIVISMAKRHSIASSIENVGVERRREIEQEQKWKTSKTPFYKVFKDMRPEWPLVVLGVIGGALVGTGFPISGLLIALCITIMIDPTVESIRPGPLAGSNLYAFLFVIVALVVMIGMTLQVGAFEVAGERYTRRLRSRLFKAFMKQEVAFYDEETNNTGALTSMLALDAKNVNEIISKIVGEISSIISTGVTGFVIAFVYSWTLSLIVLACVPFLIFGSAYEAKVEMNFEDDTKKANIQSGEVASEAINTIRTVASLTKQSYFEEKYDKAGLRPHKLAQRKAYFGSIGYAISQGMMMYMYAVCFYAGVRLIGINMINIEDMMVTLMAMMITAFGLGRSSALVSGIAKAKYAALSAFETLERQPLIDPELEGIEPVSVQGQVECEKVSFRYPARPDVPIFTGDFDFTGMAGKTIALVGASGCGKSTTIALLERWYDTLGGTVRLDEQNVQNYSLDNLRSHMSLVGQEPVLFNMSVEDNIRYGAPENIKVTENDIIKAATAANIHRFVEGLPQKYNTPVGDKGSQLSGGQKQRIAIARALLRNPRVLLLDEATSALDSESEKLVQAAIDNVIQEGGRTTITIAHRLSTIQNADVICVIERGRIVEQGTHWELLRLDGQYSTLVREQSLSATQ
ncbi:P-loop containing nucleoside triphosphate hydrolase protein [Zychaea mexicana]|uniref:P-loop containing nucleoside triphosphate hydrolase protein n=1 Tax=Zychaea mexicana TaxID=64656 RepID=UPI0022FDBE19|nr:P-loop containing nucleoside triphosphate hydrolase protein [Zychaea mexicana]KAI9498235.1 P-loop containing nucleoside triphosphate hydrolase protein [Zychaea mexicana]